MNKAIEQATRTGLVFVVAAGNSNINACLTSPASSKFAITVGAIDDYNDSVTAFSNWGECVDIFASGAYVRSVDAKNHDKTQVLSGTSMASPIVTGMVANLLSQGVEPCDVKASLIRMAAKNKITKSSLFCGKRHQIGYCIMELMKEILRVLTTKIRNLGCFYLIIIIPFFVYSSCLCMYSLIIVQF